MTPVPAPRSTTRSSRPMPGVGDEPRRELLATEKVLTELLRPLGSRAPGHGTSEHLALRLRHEPRTAQHNNRGDARHFL